MIIVPLQPDQALAPIVHTAPHAQSGFTRMVDGLVSVLGRANQSEDAFANGGGTLRSAIYDRAQADLTLDVAVAAVSRTVQSLQSILQMQV